MNKDKRKIIDGFPSVNAGSNPAGERTFFYNMISQIFRPLDENK